MPAAAPKAVSCASPRMTMPATSRPKPGRKRRIRRRGGTEQGVAHVVVATPPCVAGLCFPPPSGERDAMTSIAGPAPLRDRAAYQALERHFEQVRELHLRGLFADDPERGTRLTAEAEGLFLDYSKNRVTDETLRLLVELAEESGLRDRIQAMFSGEHINITEDRAVLHTALRAPLNASIVVDGTDIVPEVHAVLDRMARFSDAVR